jgi:hypothetical protein
MNFLDDLTRSEQQVRDRVETRRKTSHAGGLEEQQYLADQDRGTMLNRLGTIARDPRFSQSLTDAGTKQMASAKSTADLAAGEARATTLARSASRGLLGSSQSREGLANVQFQRDQAVNNAATTVADWQDQSQRGQESMLYDYLQQVLQPDTSVAAAQDAATAQASFDWDIQKQMGDNENQYRAALSQALGSFLSNGIAPGIQAGFRKADRNNRDADRNYYADLYAGKNPTKPVTQTFSWRD